MHKKENKINVLIPDGESFFALSVINCLAVKKNYDIHVLYSSNEMNGVKYSNRINSFTNYRKTDNEIDFINFIIVQLGKRKIDVLLPLHVCAIKLISKYRVLFCETGINILCPDTESLDRIYNKWELSKYLLDNNIPAPKTVNNIENIDQLKFPILFKPDEGTAGGLGIRKIQRKENVDNVIIDSKNFILQEYVSGYDIDCNVLCKDGRILAYTIQKGILASLKSFAPPVAVEFLDDERLYNMMEKLFASLKWSGVANVDLLFDEIDDDYKLIEINPRFWGSVEASEKVGVNFPDLYCLTVLERTFDKPNFRFETYINNRGLIKILRSKLEGRKHRNIKIPKNLAISNDITDPLPKITKYLSKIFSKIRTLNF